LKTARVATEGVEAMPGFFMVSAARLAALGPLLARMEPLAMEATAARAVTEGT
jgi:hypothetical protein